ncbi:MAG: hypothetical protein M1814_005779 [Vezdaea aestivalis]|nr:MAG: hypothetical protein M1814_005779 [Vezdaea aestivalis]
MPHPRPHPLALFSLLPLFSNERAKKVLAHLGNSHLVSTLDDGTLVLDVGHVRSMSGINNTLATLGRDSSSDIVVEGSSIARNQCSFEVDPVTNVVMFCDRSFGQTSQVYDENATPFEHCRRLRKVVVQKGLNTIIGAGGVKRGLVKFKLIWHHNPSEATEKVKDREIALLKENPRIVRTTDEAETVLPSRIETRLHTPGLQQLKMRYAKIGEPLGSGQFGEVHKVIDADSGRFMALKTLKPHARTSQGWEKFYNTMEREVETLSKLHHLHIVDYVTSQGWDGPAPEIFMGLKEGNLELLIKNGCSLRIEVVANSVVNHILQAIDYLAAEGIVHRDIKPENILYLLKPNNRYHFQLGDFGLSNRTIAAVTLAGSPLYMAPEISQGKRQTH